MTDPTSTKTIDLQPAALVEMKPPDKFLKNTSHEHLL